MIFFKAKINHHFNLKPDNKIFDAWQTASQIIPTVNVFHWRDWDFMWSIETGLFRENFRTVIDFIDNPTLLNSEILNPSDYAKGIKIQSGQTPFTVAKKLYELQEESLKKVETLEQLNGDKSLYLLAEDIKAMAYLGKYYAQKIEAATYLAQFTENGNPENKAKAIKKLEEAVVSWAKYGRIADSHYKTQMLARTNMLLFSERLPDVEKDIELAKSLKFQK